MGRAFEYRRTSKEKRWDKMSKLFPKLAKNITLAAKEGGGDAEHNAKLRSAILIAKANNLPKDNIEAAIKRATSKEDAILRANYEIKAMHGVLILLECASDNLIRTIANIKSYCNKSNAQIIPNGSLEFIFSHCSFLQLQLPENINIDDVELFFIDYGLEELEIDNNDIYIYGDMINFSNLMDGFKLKESEGFILKEARLIYESKQKVILNNEQKEELEKLFNRLDDDDDIAEIWSNIENQQ